MSDPTPPAPVQKQILEKMSTLMTSAFALVAALAWNEAIKAAFTQIFDPGKGRLIGLFGYAVVVTVIAVLATLWIAKAAQKVEALEAQLRARLGGEDAQAPTEAGS